MFYYVHRSLLVAYMVLMRSNALYSHIFLHLSSIQDMILHPLFCALCLDALWMLRLHGRAAIATFDSSKTHAIHAVGRAIDPKTESRSLQITRYQAV